MPDLINFYRLEEVKAIEFSRTMVEFMVFYDFNGYSDFMSINHINYLIIFRNI